ncbi:glycine betaine ABC transporter substrate-binding protein [Actinokineospora iranica]|uniref:Osmoprotectant transport system substrate-binding protein n=1 Tax=Actinokineospora iranica TaxID=1271860 RepID=A0A1G6LWE8_9PSEU|nr:glycine betaine ABC transporter substrate-binding protein [Actinokineospora iranica]SDC47592.1 osmoprotectant transport system substrate-binding protein [Actinokineospora iranica]
MNGLRTRLAALAAVCGLLAGCGLDSNITLPLNVLPGSLPAPPDLAGVRIVVGSKDFTEQIVLGHITEFALAAAGADVVDLTNIQGSNSARQALLTGDIDVQWEYTGTAWVSYLGQTEPIPDERLQFEAVRELDRANGLEWLDFAPLNNTYAFGMRREVAERLGITTISQLAEAVTRDPALGVFCVETEFVSRDDGFPGVQQAYGFRAAPANMKIFGAGAIYQALANGACTFGEITSTDGRTLALDLTVLVDDRKFFPQYNAAPVVRTDFLAAHPGVRDVLAPLAERLDNGTMQRLSAQVDVYGADPVEVARDWLVREGFIRLP